MADFILGGSKILQMVIAAMKLKDTYSLEGKLWPTRQHIKKQRHHFTNKGPSSQGYVFPVVMSFILSFILFDVCVYLFYQVLKS